MASASWHLLPVVMAVLMMAPIGGLAKDVDCVFPFLSSVPVRCDLYQPNFFDRDTWQLRDCHPPFRTTACAGTVTDGNGRPSGDGNILHGECTTPVATSCSGTLSPRGVKCVNSDKKEVVRCAPPLAGAFVNFDVAAGGIPAATNTATEETPRGPGSCNANGTEGITPVFAPMIHTDGWIECATFAAKCAAAAFKAYETKNLSPLIACASLSTICDCASSLPSPVGPFIHDKICSITVREARTTRRGPSPLVVDAALSSGGTCPPNWERIPANGQQCYSPSCPPGYNLIGGGDDVRKYCWKDCDLGWTDNGETCSVSLDTYGKGCCCTVFGCCHNCRPTYTDNGCTCGRSHKEFTKDHQLRDSVPVQY